LHLAARRPYAGHGIAGSADLDFRLPRGPRIRVMRGRVRGMVKVNERKPAKG